MTQKLTVKIQLNDRPLPSEESEELAPYDKGKIGLFLLVLLLPVVLLVMINNDWEEVDEFAAVDTPHQQPVKSDAAQLDTNKSHANQSGVNQTDTNKVDVNHSSPQQVSTSDPHPEGSVNVIAQHSLPPASGDSTESVAEPVSEPVTETLATAIPNRIDTTAMLAEPVAHTDEIQSAGSSPVPGPQLFRAQLTSEIRQHEPVDQLGEQLLATDKLTTLYFFTEVGSMSGQLLRHRWYLDEELVAEVPLRIGSERWRTHSSKRLAKFMTGRWRVEAIGADNQILAQHHFSYLK